MLRKLMQYELKKSWMFGLLSVVFLILFILSVIGNPRPRIKVSHTRINLELYRRNVQAYKEIVGQYPETLASMHEYAIKNPDKKLSKRKFKEYISSSEGVWCESDKLDGSGGWYYDKSTGELRINLNKSVKHYFKLYINDTRNEIPSEW